MCIIGWRVGQRTGCVGRLECMVAATTITMRNNMDGIIKLFLDLLNYVLDCTELCLDFTVDLT